MIIITRQPSVSLWSSSHNILLTGVQMKEMKAIAHQTLGLKEAEAEEDKQILVPETPLTINITIPVATATATTQTNTDVLHYNTIAAKQTNTDELNINTTAGAATLSHCWTRLRKGWVSTSMRWGLTSCARYCLSCRTYSRR